MHRSFILAGLVAIALFAVAACGGSSTPTASATPTATPGAIVAPAGDISSLLFPDEVAVLAGGVRLTTEYRDQKSAAAAIDPVQVEHMDSFSSLSFTTEDDSRSLVLTTIDFDSEAAAIDRLGLLTAEPSGMQDTPVTIGDVSAYLELNDAGIGSMVVFKKGEWAVVLHTAQADGVTPLVDIEGVQALARTVASRL